MSNLAALGEQPAPQPLSGVEELLVRLETLIDGFTSRLIWKIVLINAGLVVAGGGLAVIAALTI